MLCFHLTSDWIWIHENVIDAIHKHNHEPMLNLRFSAAQNAHNLSARKPHVLWNMDYSYSFPGDVGCSSFPYSGCARVW